MSYQFFPTFFRSTGNSTHMNDVFKFSSRGGLQKWKKINVIDELVVLTFIKHTRTRFGWNNVHYQNIVNALLIQCAQNGSANKTCGAGNEYHYDVLNAFLVTVNKGEHGLHEGVKAL